ncbi:hypothetical protein niasHT_008320 [Heterodera trifolii]|uniref:Uncharacterized protein n=1 Tax=Heterodera trifolii TaxID=157864 RepID=A0ABD2M1E4_9BILA
MGHLAHHHMANMAQDSSDHHRRPTAPTFHRRKAALTPRQPARSAVRSASVPMAHHHMADMDRLADHQMANMVQDISDLSRPTAPTFHRRKAALTPRQPARSAVRSASVPMAHHHMADMDRLADHQMANMVQDISDLSRPTAPTFHRRKAALTPRQPARSAVRSASVPMAHHHMADMDRLADHQMANMVQDSSDLRRPTAPTFHHRKAALTPRQPARSAVRSASVPMAHHHMADMDHLLADMDHLAHCHMANMAQDSSDLRRPTAPTFHHRKAALTPRQPARSAVRSASVPMVHHHMADMDRLMAEIDHLANHHMALESSVPRPATVLTFRHSHRRTVNEK